jgi:AmmeMemoRadiSam system protein A
VTLTVRARLRGCIGRVEPDQPLRSMIPAVACSAAFADPRFPPVGAGELTALVIEISLLSVPALLADPGDVVVGRHGLVIASHGRRGLLLPQVATEYAWSREEFLDQVCAKAGLPPGTWREPGVRIHSFTAEVFSEEEE